MKKIDIQSQFNRVAGEYDINRRKFIPDFDSYYKDSTDFLAFNIRPPKRILDLGAGTGLVSSFWYPHFPEADYVLVDIAEAMLSVAKKRFEGMANVNYKTMDYLRGFPDGLFDLVVSGLSIHHLEDNDKSALFRRILKILPSSGIFVNYDMFISDEPLINTWFDSFRTNRLQHSGLTSHDLALAEERKKLDRECSIDTEITLLREAGFKEVSCIFSCRKFAVLVAVASR